MRVCIDFPARRRPRDLRGESVRVRVQKPFGFLPILGIGEITIRGSSTMRIERLRTRDPGQLLRRTSRLFERGMHMTRRSETNGAVSS